MTLLPDPTLEDTPEKIQFVQVANAHVMETTEKSRKSRKNPENSGEHGHYTPENMVIVSDGLYQFIYRVP